MKHNITKCYVCGAIITKSGKPRNLGFHRKYFALLKIGYDNWEPEIIGGKYGTPQKNFDRFRKDVTILCGYYNVVVRLDGTTRIEPDSISFASMSAETFQELYSKTIDLFIEKIYKGSMTADEMNEMVMKYLEFA